MRVLHFYKGALPESIGGVERIVDELARGLPAHGITADVLALARGPSRVVAMDGYKPDALAREISQVSWCPIFTRHELEKAFEGLPFERVADECVHDYEHEFLPPDAWPPTGWFVNWSLGSDLFALPPGRAPIEMRWLSYRKQ